MHTLSACARGRREVLARRSRGLARRCAWGWSCLQSPGGRHRGMAGPMSHPAAYHNAKLASTQSLSMRAASALRRMAAYPGSATVYSLTSRSVHQKIQNPPSLTRRRVKLASMTSSKWQGFCFGRLHGGKMGRTRFRFCSVDIELRQDERKIGGRKRRAQA
jgi:hypothetical protein